MPPATTSARQLRHEAILRLLASRSVSNQTALAELLAEEGLGANQATLSRDLRELGVLKTPEGYALPDPTAIDDLTRACREWLIGAEAIAHQLVLRTPPGGAAPLSIALDAQADRVDGLAGTIAGDDTVLVICRTPRAASRLCRDLIARLPR